MGRKLLDVEYAALRSQLRSSKVRSGLRELLRADLPVLLLWVLEGEGRKDLPYPFALAHGEFYRRCTQFPQRAQRWLPRPRSRPAQGVLRQAEAVLAGLQHRDGLAWAVPRLERSWAAFSALRDVLRLRDDELPRGDRRTPALLASSSPVTFPQLQAALGDASRTTTFRYLQQVRYLRSYNHNGRYYTLRDRLGFDRHGLVSLGDIHFSRDRTLGATV